MRLYSADEYKVLRTLELIDTWQDDGVLTEQQRLKLQEESACDLRTTNLFLRIALFAFTLGILGLAQVLLLVLVSLLVPQGTDKQLPLLVLLFAGVCYTAAECVVKEFRLFHFGIEEACATCSIALLCFALQLHHGEFKAGADLGELLIMAVCAVASLWVWHRFGYWYAFVAAMVFVAFSALCLTTTPVAVHALIAVLYVCGLVAVIAARRNPRLDDPQDQYPVAEALLWFGIYCSLNLVPYKVVPRWLFGPHTAAPPVFYWCTWVLIWCLPPVILLRGIRRKERTLLFLGAVLLLVTFVSNKPYLGWPRHPWDPMMLGVVLMVTVWSLQRWLAQGEDGVRDGFTAARVAGKGSAWLSAGTSVFSLIAPQALSYAPHPGVPTAPDGEGGASGGGGAGGAF